jgi:Ser/Thr protein kinase RdoA (MazF antagonist)
MEPVALVLAAWPAVRRSARVAHLARGGFSGALVWRLTTPAGEFCLRAATPSEAEGHLRQRHELMARAREAGLPFVPAVLPTREGATVYHHGGRCWELMGWMPGRADFHSFPTKARLRAAASALARLHRSWQPPSVLLGPCPAVSRRLTASRRDTAGPTPAHPLLDDLLARTRRSLSRWRPEAIRLLAGWQDRAWALQPCLRDVWHDHLLFEGDGLTGLVDYAGAGPDSVAADLGRMLGSLVGDNDAEWRTALEAYREHAPLTEDQERLARVLDRTGVIGGLGNWLRWLSAPGGAVPDVSLGARRLEELLRRVEGW